MYVCMSVEMMNNEGQVILKKVLLMEETIAESLLEKMSLTV